MKTRAAGIDINGDVLRVGETDSMGYRVGWIDEDGDCWVSERERDLAVTAGRYIDERREWKRGFRSRPSKLAIAFSETNNLRNIPAVLRNMTERLV